MGFTSDEEPGSGGRMPDIEAEITNIGVDYREYNDGNAENRLIVIWKPTGEVFGTQTEILSNSGLLKVVPSPQNIQVGGEEHGFNIEVLGDVIEGNGKLGYKAALWMNTLSKLGVRVPSKSGDLKELKGLTAVLSQKTYNEAMGREKTEKEKPFWVPIKILKLPDGPGVVQPAPSESVETTKLSLEDAVLAVVDFKAEKELVDWYERSSYYNGVTSVPLFKVIDSLKAKGAIKTENGVYVVMREDQTVEHFLAATAP